MNHAKGNKANIVAHPPLMVDGLPRVAFLAKRDISLGEELMWDYGVDLEKLLGLKETCSSSSSDLP